MSLIGKLFGANAAARPGFGSLADIATAFVMSALHPKADIRRGGRNVRFGRWSQPVDATLSWREKIECIARDQRFRRGFTAAEKAEL
jgi:hypothetical protein